MINSVLLISSVILDFIFGDPYWLYHPIIFIGNIIKIYEKVIRRILNNKIGGLFLTVSTVFTVVFILNLLLIIKDFNLIIYYIINIFLMYTAIAAKSLKVEALKVYFSLKNNKLVEARNYLSYIVSRDTNKLTVEEVIKGTVETVSENNIDGVLAPMFYIFIGLFFGYPVHAVYIYKTINTLDSMVGYTTDYYKDIGFFSAKLDDILNFIPARIGSLIMLIAGGLLKYDFMRGYLIFIRDRLAHKSPNSGHPEAVVSGLLNVKLGGSNTYFGKKVFKPTIGDNIKKLEPFDIVRTCRIMYLSQILTTIIMTIFLLKFSR